MKPFFFFLFSICFLLSVSVSGLREANLTSIDLSYYVTVDFNSGLGRVPMIVSFFSICDFVTTKVDSTFLSLSLYTISLCSPFSFPPIAMHNR